MLAEWGDAERKLTERVSVLAGELKGQYPSGNTLMVKGARETVLIDPSIDVVTRGGVPAPVDAILNSHSHEDHIAGNGLFPEARVHIHDADRVGVASLDGLMSVYGMQDPESEKRFRRAVVDIFNFTPRPDAQGFSDGDVFDLGGTKVEAVHLPGHTRGHSGFRVSEDVFFLSDIDLTGFGPYYGDAWSDLDDFESSLTKVRDEDAAYYVTFHHKGVIEGRARFLELLDAFGAVIGRRHEAMLEFLKEPHTVDEMVAHRFIYRPAVKGDVVVPVEMRSAQLHLDRMKSRGEIREVEPGRFQAL
ncbi:MAG: MBL fold metallo-hydrolase [Myxococcota bacterium]